MSGALIAYGKSIATLWSRGDPKPWKQGSSKLFAGYSIISIWAYVWHRWSIIFWGPRTETDVRKPKTSPQGEPMVILSCACRSFTAYKDDQRRCQVPAAGPRVSPSFMNMTWVGSMYPIHVCQGRNTERSTSTRTNADPESAREQRALMQLCSR